MAKTYTIINNSTVSPGNDVTFGSGANQVLLGTPGTDVYFAFSGNDQLSGDAGDDFLLGETGNDTLDGGTGDDFLFFADDNYFNSGYRSNFVGAASAIADVRDRQFLEDEWYDVFNITQTANPGTDITIAGGDGFDTAVVDLSFSGVARTFAFTAGAALTLPNGTSDLSGVEALWLRGGGGGDTFTGGANNDRLYGGGGADKLRGGDGDDVLVGGTGLDDLRGEGGNDFIVSTDFYTEFERSAVTQLPLDYVKGLAAIVSGTTATLAAQSDALIDGGDGNDTAVLDFEANGAAVNFVLNPASLATLPGLPTQIRNVEAIWAIDSNNNDTFVGGNLDDRFLTIGGVDSFDGGAGVDTYELLRTAVASNVNLANNALNTGAAAGDTLTDIENVVGSQNANIITGDAQNNLFQGRAGNDTLNGAGGNDTLDGGAGADTLNGGTGDDTASYESATGRVRVDLLNTATNTGNAAGDVYINIDNLVGTRRGDILLGDDAANKIDGGLGRDTVQGRGGADTFAASANNDSFDGGDGSDTLTLSGARANYTVTLAAGVFTITDNRGPSFDGTDTATNVESFAFSDGTRTAADILNAAPAGLAFTQNGTLSELAPAGTVVGTLAATDADGDPLTFTLDAAGSDLFNVDGNQLKLKSSANIDFDASTGGSPTRNFGVTVSDGKGGTASGSFQITIVNDTADDKIQGTNDDDTLEGTAGADKMFGLDGNDTLKGSLGADLLNGGNDTDTASYGTKVKLDLSDADGSSNTGEAEGDTFQSIERFRLSSSGDSAKGNDNANNFDGRAGNDVLRGEGGNDTLAGGSGDDRIYGGRGKDTLAGGSGKDTFYFDTALSAKKNVDTIISFSHNDDSIKLDKDIFVGLTGSKLSADAFVLGTKAVDAEDRIIYDKAKGDLYFDSDGSKGGHGAVKFASVDDGKFLDNTDFLII